MRAVAKQETGSEADTPLATRGLANGGCPLELSRVSVGAGGCLQTSADKPPLAFSFTWRGHRFLGSLAPGDAGQRIALTSHVIRSGAEALVDEPAERGSMLAVIEKENRATEASLRLIAGGRVLLRDRFRLPPAGNSAIDDIVANLTALVLLAAPYLDLLAEHSPRDV